MTANLWAIFVEDGRLHARRLHEGLMEQARVSQDARALGRAAQGTLGADAYTIATLALTMGVEEVGRLAFLCERAFAYLAAGPAGAAPVQVALVEATQRLVDAFETLAHPDASGARVDADPLQQAARQLEQAMTQESTQARAPVEPSAPAAAPAGEDDRVWVPSVDEDMVDLFMDEATERLEALSHKLLTLEARPGELEVVREIFRDLHTIKGSSGMVALKRMNRLAHAAEDLVGQVRDGSRHADKPLIDALLAAVDGLRAILQQAQRRAPIDVELQPLLARLRNPLAGTEPAAAAASQPPVGGADPAAATASQALAKRDSQKQTIRVDFDKLDLLLNLVGELVLSKAGITTGIQGLGSLGRELEHERRLARRASAHLVTSMSATHRVTAGGVVALTRTNPGPALRLSHEGAGGGRSLRLLSDELGRVERVFQEIAHDLDVSSNRLDRVSAELRDQVMKLRMVPIGGVFRKYHRTVRDLAHALGKSVRLELTGEDTELDKILVEQLDDPLMHLVRNAVDHGIEPPAARTQAGKDPEGVLRLSAYHRGNQIVIEIADDGGGIDPARLRVKALEKRIATPEELDAMDDRAVLDVIFRPGFSTAARVSEVSGRGVGMDVVRDAIVSRLKGSVDVRSQVGRGTTFELRLPLTLAIIQVLLARAAGEVFAVPLDVVSRTLTCTPRDVRHLYDREVLPVKDLPRDRDAVGQASERQVPLVRLSEVLALEGLTSDADDDQLHVILVDVFGSTYGLVCERLLGKQEIVIKSLGDLLVEVPCAAGATLVGDRCVIILDVPALVSRAIQSVRPSPATPIPSPAGASSGIPDKDRAAPLRILLVEDSDLIRASMKRVLEEAGYQVTEARDGVEGLRAASAADFDLVSTDVIMPNLDGYELTRALRASERHRDTPIVMVTSRGEKIDRVRGFDAGVDEYITKPHDRQDLLRAVAKHVRRKEPKAT